jgi:hypothetical protein
MEIKLLRVCRIPLNFAMSGMAKSGELEKLYLTPTCEVGRGGVEWSALWAPEASIGRRLPRANGFVDAIG